jgi:hypothetical protein
MTTVLRFHALYIASVSTDITYDNVGAATWSAVELNVGIICACIPAMRPLINLVFPRLLSTTRTDPGSNYYPNTGGIYVRNESNVEGSRVVIKSQSEVSKDNTISFDHGNNANAIRMKTEWTVSEGGHV